MIGPVKSVRCWYGCAAIIIYRLLDYHHGLPYYKDIGFYTHRFAHGFGSFILAAVSMLHSVSGVHRLIEFEFCSAVGEWPLCMGADVHPFLVGPAGMGRERKIAGIL